MAGYKGAFVGEGEILQRFTLASRPGKEAAGEESAEDGGVPEGRAPTRLDRLAVEG